MSPTPVIQALKWLEFQGLVRREPNRGYYTEPISLKEVEEIYDLRELLEPSLLPKALQSQDQQGLQRFKTALEAHNAALQEKYLNKRLLTDMEFHLSLASLSDCLTHQQILRHLFDLLYLKYRGDILFFTLMRTVGSEHQAIYDAVAARDLKLTQETLTGHIRNVKQHVLAGLQRGLEEKQESGF
jgi:DNA-binding GntR family transcriptional regulator